MIQADQWTGGAARQTDSFIQKAKAGRRILRRACSGNLRELVGPEESNHTNAPVVRENESRSTSVSTRKKGGAEVLRSVIAGDFPLKKPPRDSQGTNLKFFEEPRFEALLRTIDGLPSPVGAGLEQSGHEDRSSQEGQQPLLVPRLALKLPVEGRTARRPGPSLDLRRR